MQRSISQDNASTQYTKIIKAISDYRNVAVGKIRELCHKYGKEAGHSEWEIDHAIGDLIKESYESQRRKWGRIKQ